MTAIEDFGLYVVRALALLAHWLEGLTAPVPWPVVTAVAAVPLLAAVRFAVWFLRGAVWPVRCKHPATTVRRGGDSACRSVVAGEWRYCRHHNHWHRNSRGQLVDPTLPRWKTVAGGAVVDRTDVLAAGASTSLLFHRGFTRKPAEVWESLPSVLRERQQGVRVAMARLRGQQPPGEATHVEGAPAPTREEQERYRGVHLRAVQADQALLALKWLLPVTFVVTAASAFVPGRFTLPVEYAALLLVWVCVEIVRCGLLSAPSGDGWVRRTFTSSVRAFAALVGVAVACSVLDGRVLPFISGLLEPAAAAGAVG